MDVDVALEKIVSEYHSATRKFKRFNSVHEGFAVIKEEIDELWIEVKRNPIHPGAIERELVQCGAMILRFLTDLVGRKAEDTNRLAETINQIIDEEAACYAGTCGYSKDSIGKSHFFPALGNAIARNLHRLK